MAVEGLWPGEILDRRCRSRHRRRLGRRLPPWRRCRGIPLSHLPQCPGENPKSADWAAAALWRRSLLEGAALGLWEVCHAVCVQWRRCCVSSGCGRPSSLHLAGGLNFDGRQCSGVHASRSQNFCSLASRFTCSCALVGAVLLSDGAASSIQGEKVWTFFEDRVDDTTSPGRVTPMVCFSTFSPT